MTYREKAQERARGAAEALLKFVNRMDFDAVAFAKTICASHRTLQRSVMGLMLMVIDEMARHHDNGGYDLRNEDSVTVAKKIVEAISENGCMPGLRCV